MSDRKSAQSMNYWIFTVKDARIGTEKKQKGIEIYTQRMSDAFWGLREKISNRDYIEKGDFVVFYLAGGQGHKFLGTCTLASNYYELGREEKKMLCHAPFFQSDHGVKLAEIEVWDEPVSIFPLIKSLSFIEDPKVWGTYLQGSIHRISESDYSVIVGSAMSREILELSDMKKPVLTDETSRTMASRRVRDAVFMEQVKKIYDYGCAVCGKRRFSRSNHPEVESSHIKPKGEEGSDDLRNGIALCRLHHWAFDEGLFSIKDDYSIVVENRIRNVKDYVEIFAFANRKIRLPNAYAPHYVFLREHRKRHGFA